MAQTWQALNSQQSAKGYERIIREILRRSGYFNCTLYFSIELGKIITSIFRYIVHPVFDQMPPCDDCLQRARRHGSYGDVCQSMNDPLTTPMEECGFQMQPLTPTSNNTQPLPSLPSGLPPDLDLNFPANNSRMMHHNNPTVTEGYCCKHGISTGTSGGSGSLNYNDSLRTPSLMIVSRRESFDEKEEVEAVESSV